MIGILGSGFGLYGYLPAFMEVCDQPIILPERYHQRFNARAELTRFAHKVQWAADDSETLKCADTIALVKRPADQGMLVARCLRQDNVERLLLEKPLAPTPLMAAELFDTLILSRRIVRIGYVFRYTGWASFLPQYLQEPRRGGISIRWSFLAHHFRHNLQNWKRFHDQGGGAIRFYGIQLMAILAELGYCEVVGSNAFGGNQNEVDKWSATFAGPNLPICEIAVDSRGDTNEFKISMTSADSSDRILIAQDDPFGMIEHVEEVDRRVEILKPLCRSLWQTDVDCYAWYKATNQLWSVVEALTRFWPHRGDDHG